MKTFSSKSVTPTAWRILMLRHEAQNFSNSKKSDPVFTKLHRHDDSPNLNRLICPLCPPRVAPGYINIYISWSHLEGDSGYINIYSLMHSSQVDSIHLKSGDYNHRALMVVLCTHCEFSLKGAP